MTRMTRRLGAALCVASLAGPAWALDLNAYLQAVKDQSPSLQQADADADARAASARQEAAWSNPTLAVEGGSKNDELNRGSAVGASLSQSFAWPGKRGAQLEAAALEAEGKPFARRAIEASLVQEALEAALAQSAAQRHWANALDRKEHLEPVQSFLRSQTFASPQQKTDRDVVETRLHNQAAERARHELELAGAREGAQALAGAPLDWSLPAALDLALAPTVDDVLQGNPELALARLELRRAAAQGKLAAKQGLGEPELSVGYEREELGGTEQTIRGGLSLPLPLMNVNGAAKEAAASAERAAEARVRALTRQLQRKAAALRQRLQSLSAAAAVYPAGALEALEKGLKEAERQFKVGRLALISYLEYEAEAAETREALLELGAQQAQVLVELRALAGAVDAPAAFLKTEGSHAE